MSIMKLELKPENSLWNEICVLPYFTRRGEYSIDIYNNILMLSGMGEMGIIISVR